MDLRVGDMVFPSGKYSHEGEVTEYVAPDSERRYAMHTIGKAKVMTSPEHEGKVVAYVPVRG